MAARPRFGWQSSRVSQRCRGAVDPVELARHPPAGLVEVHGVGLAQRAPHLVGEGFGQLSGLGHHLGQRSHRYRDPEQIAEQLGHAPIGQVLVHGQVGGERPHAVAIGGRSGGLGREGGLRLAATAAPPTLGDVLDHPHTRSRARRRPAGVRCRAPRHQPDRRHTRCMPRGDGSPPRRDRPPGPGVCPRRPVACLVVVPPLGARPGWAASTTLRLTAASTSCGDCDRDVVPDRRSWLREQR